MTFLNVYTHACVDELSSSDIMWLEHKKLCKRRKNEVLWLEANQIVSQTHTNFRLKLDRVLHFLC